LIMTRLPQPGADTGYWGEILNEYLLEEHNSDGTHKVGPMLAAPAEAGHVLVSDPTATHQVSWQTIVQLLPSGSPSQVLQTTNTGTLTWVTMTKTSVGLGNVDNTADSDKPISTAQQAALTQKADDAAVVKLAGNQTVGGVKTFSTAPRVPGLQDVNGGAAVAINAVASAVNHVKITTNTTGNDPRIEPEGDTNVNLVIKAKGTGAVKLADGSGKTALQTAAATNAVNYVSIRNSATNFAPFISADGSDTNISLYIRGKGAAGVVLSDSIANKVVEVNGTSRLGFFGAATVTQQVGGAKTAGATYTANEQTMLNAVYTALRNYGLLT
jgi:hypothetical protein